MAAKNVKLVDSLIEALAKASSKGEQQTILKKAGLSQNEGKAALKEADRIKMAVPVGEPRTPGEDFSTANPKEWDMMNPQQQKDYTSTGKVPTDVSRAYEDAATGSGLNLPAPIGVTPSFPEPAAVPKGVTDLVTTGQPVLEQAKVNRYQAPEDAAGPSKSSKGLSLATAGAGALGLGLAGDSKDPEDVPADIPGAPSSGIRLPDDLGTGIKAGQKASSVSKVAQAPETPTPTPVTPAPATIEGPTKARELGLGKYEKKREDASKNFDMALADINWMAKTSEGEEKQKYEKLNNSLNIVRDKIDAFDSNERKMLAWERVGDMLARSLGQLGAGLAGVSKPLELQAADQSARYADLQALGKQQRESLGQERALGEKSYSERMRDIGKDAAEQRDASTRKYTTDTASVDREMAAEQRSVDSVNDFMARTQAFKEREADRTAATTDKKTKDLKEGITKQLGFQYADADKEKASADREINTYIQLDKAFSNPKTLKTEIDRIKKENPDETSWLGGSTLSSTEATQQLRDSITTKKSAAEARRKAADLKKTNLLKEGETISYMDATELNNYVSNKKKGITPPSNTANGEATPEERTTEAGLTYVRGTLPNGNQGWILKK